MAEKGYNVKVEKVGFNHFKTISVSHWHTCNFTDLVKTSP